MDHTPVISSSIVSVGYDPESTTLELEFVNGHVYQYFGVPESIYKDLLAADSIGAFVNTHIKGHYRYDEVG